MYLLIIAQHKIQNVKNRETWSQLNPVININILMALNNSNHTWCPKV